MPEPPNYSLIFPHYVTADVTAERSFSAMRSLKTYLRATMKQERLTHVTVLRVHQNKLNSTDVQKCMMKTIS